MIQMTEAEHQKLQAQAKRGRFLMANPDVILGESKETGWRAFDAGNGTTISGWHKTAENAVDRAMIVVGWDG